MGDKCIKQCNSKATAENWSVYFLICPINKNIRYVGISKQPKKRLYQHIVRVKNTQKSLWISDLKDKNLHPIQKIICSNLTEKDACDFEEIIGKFLVEFVGAEIITNDISSLGSVPPHRKNENHYNIKKRKFKVWNDTEEYIFNYQWEAIKKLNFHPGHLWAVLNKKLQTHKGYFICYVDELDTWEYKKPRNKGKTHYLVKKRKFKVWNNVEEYYFDYVVDAVNVLNLVQSKVYLVLNKKRKKHKGYRMEYCDEVNLDN